MTTGQLLEKEVIYFENIVDGMKCYENQTVCMDAQQACERLLNLWKICGYKDVYVDFYYYRLPEESQLRIDTMLSSTEKEYILRMQPQDDEVIFQADEVLLSICTRLNAAEMLFSTIYVAGEHRSTWWGNYNQEYIIFTEGRT